MLDDWNGIRKVTSQGHIRLYELQFHIEIMSDERNPACF